MLIKTVATLLEFSLLLTTREKGIQFSCFELESSIGKEQKLWNKTKSRLDYCWLPLFCLNYWVLYTEHLEKYMAQK